MPRVTDGTSTNFLLRLSPEEAQVVRAWARVSGTPVSVVLRQCIGQMVPLLRVMVARLDAQSGPLDAVQARADVEAVLREVLSGTDVSATDAGADYIRVSRTLIGDAGDRAVRGVTTG